MTPRLRPAACPIGIYTSAPKAGSLLTVPLINISASGSCHGGCRFTCSQAPREKRQPPCHPSLQIVWHPDSASQLEELAL